MADSHNGKTIVGVDDVPENLLLLKSTLEPEGYIFFGCDSGIKCLELLLRLRADLLLLDVQMPVLDGFETCLRLRRRLDFSTLPVVFLTARKNAEDLRAGLDAGGNDFLLKPFEVAKLLLRVAHWCGRRYILTP